MTRNNYTTSSLDQEEDNLDDTFESDRISIDAMDII